MKGHIYLLVNSSYPNLVKIGKTSRTPEERTKELNTTGVPTNYVIAFSIEVDDMDGFETYLHRHFSKYRRNKDREFFEIDSTTIINKIHESKELFLNDLRAEVKEKECKTDFQYLSDKKYHESFGWGLDEAERNGCLLMTLADLAEKFLSYQDSVPVDPENLFTLFKVLILGREDYSFNRIINNHVQKNYQTFREYYDLHEEFPDDFRDLISQKNFIQDDSSFHRDGLWQHIDIFALFYDGALNPNDYLSSRKILIRKNDYFHNIVALVAYFYEFKHPKTKYFIGVTLVQLIEVCLEQDQDVRGELLIDLYRYIILDRERRTEMVNNFTRTLNHNDKEIFFCVACQCSPVVHEKIMCSSCEDYVKNTGDVAWLKKWQGGGISLLKELLIDPVN